MTQPPPYPQQPPHQPVSQPVPQYPQPPRHIPQYPQAATPVPPQYPAHPQYPRTPPSAPPTAPPAAPPVPALPPGTPPAPTDPDHPHHIDTGPRRIHIADRQRRTDATAFGNLVLHVPNFVCSFFVVGLVSLFFGRLGFLLVVLWLASGALVFHRPTERALARYALRLRHPTPQEQARLEPVWREVTARAGVEGRVYELWVEDSDRLNAVAAAGHIVGVTRFAVNRLPNGELAAVLAHELGHHVGGHAWSGLLGYWYALPGRITWRVLKTVSAVAFHVSKAFGCLGVGIVVSVIGTVAVATISTLYGIPLLILVMPYALAAVGRRSELRADEHAAALGFAPMLAAVLDKLHQQEQYDRAVLAARIGAAAEESAVRELLASHPDHHTRLHHLRPYLQPQPPQPPQPPQQPQPSQHLQQPWPQQPY